LDSIKSGFTQIIYPRSYSKAPQQQQAHPTFHQTQRIWILQSLNTLDSTYSSLEKMVHLAIKVESQILKKTSFKTTHNDGFYHSSWKDKNKTSSKKIPSKFMKDTTYILEFIHPQPLHLSHPPKPQVKNVLNV